MTRQQWWGLHPSHSKDLEIDEDGFELVRYHKHYSHVKAMGNLAKIKAKTSELKKKTLRGTVIEIIEHRPHLSRSILIPLRATSWIRKTPSDTLELIRLTISKWKTKLHRPKFEAPSEEFQRLVLRIKENIQDDQLIQICMAGRA